MSLSNLSACKSTQVATEFQTTMLCVPCSTLDIKSLLLGQEVDHHTSYSTLMQSARDGCELCTLITKSKGLKFGNISLPTKAIFIVCESNNKWTRSYPTKCITPQTPIIALGFYTEGERVDPVFPRGIGVCTTQDDPLCDIVQYRLIQSDCGSYNGLQVAVSWLQRCLASHHEFCSNVESLLPKRVIHIGSINSTSDPYLLETDNETGAWVALSHCWGQGTSFTTTTTNLSERKKCILFADFPATFRDAITISRKLGIEHLWIDSLCIIQDSASDWLEESRQMKQVYSNATVTLVAEASENSHCGIFTTANAGRPNTVHVPFRDGRGSTIGSLYSQEHSQYVSVVRCYTPGPLSSRAWALQEDVLSRRIIRYASDQLLWSCHTSFHPESNPFGFSQIQALGDPRNFRRQTQLSDAEIRKRELLSFWYTIVGQYRNRRLTFEKDKFPALSGIAMEMAERLKYTYTAGLWLEDIHVGLMWMNSGNACRSPEYIAPSWSWACLTQLPSQHNWVDHPSLSYYKLRPMFHIAEILRVDVSTVGGNPYGQVTTGILRVRGPSKIIPSRKARKFNIQVIAISLDVGSKELDGDILFMQILEGQAAAFEITVSRTRSAACILLEPTNQIEEYRRIGVASFEAGSAELDDGWEVREVTVI